MLAGVAINVLTPIQVGYVVDHLEGGSGKFAWAAVLAYAGLRYFQGGAGVLKTIQNQTWEPVEEHLLTEISTELKEYLKGLSPEERAYMKMDEAQKTIFKGAKCIIQLLSQVSFHIFPLLATMVVSITVLGAGYTFLGGLIVFITMAAYTYLTIVITEKQKSKNGQQKASAALSLTQNSIISTGVLVGSLWYAWQISRNRLTAGDFVVFNMYILQLGTPLRFLGNFYQMTQKSFKNLGDMSMLFTNKETSTSIQEVAGSSTTDPSNAHIVFDQVQFGYDGERDIFKNLSFTVKKDAFVAIVGPSGCGKSTLMRLIFRFYDPLSGKIYMNGQDSKHIEHSVLRQNIGFIPQNTILFNDTVLYNIRHGNIDASDEDVFHAAQVAQVHNQILKFPQGYATRLGERGYKISDSVKQRIAIARAVLKNPNLLLLDEATSALGAKREKNIQKGLADFSDNCTVFFATRRLSSIVDADVILVMKEGQLMECGTHKELLERASRTNTSSLYANMWQKQVQSSNSSCQDSKNDNTSRINENNSSEQEQPVSQNAETGESSGSNNKPGFGLTTSIIPNTVKVST
jgi:ATP-binding cassette subfamily B (MDR/TAP) protein 6